MTETPPTVPTVETPKPPTPAPEAPVDAVPKKEISTPEQVNKALEEMGKKLLDQNDPRAGIVALARLAGEGKPTPIADELRYDVVSALQQDTLATDAIKGVTLGEKPATSALETFLDQSQEGKQAKARLELEKINGATTLNRLTDMATIHGPLRESFFKALLGDNHPPFNSAEDVVKILQPAAKPESLPTPVQPFMPDEKNVKTFGEFMQKGLSVGFAGVMVLQFGMSLAQDGSHAGH